MGEQKILLLIYADDIVLLAEDEGSMRSMLGRLEGYLDKKRLEVNAEKTKVIRFRKGRGRISKARWFWKKKELEEVRKYKYLGYRLHRNGGQKVQGRDSVEKAAAVMGQIWGTGKRKFERD